MSDDWITALRSEPVDTEPRDDFREELRYVLGAEWDAVNMPTGTRPPNRRRGWALGAAAASVAVLIVGLIAVAIRDDADNRTLSPSEQPPAPATTAAPTPTLSTVAPPTSTIHNGLGVTTFDIVSAFGDVAPDALAITTDGRVVAAVGTQLLVRNLDGGIRPIALPDDTEVTHVWVGPDDIAVAWGTQRGVEVDLSTGEILSALTRTDDTWTDVTWTRANIDAAGFRVNPPRPYGPLRLGVFGSAATQRPEVEGSGCFESVWDQNQSWTISRPADCVALVDEIAPLDRGGYLVTLRDLGHTPDAQSDIYPFVLHPDGTVEALATIDTSERTVDVQPGGRGLTVLTIDATTATIEHIATTDVPTSSTTDAPDWVPALPVWPSPLSMSDVPVLLPDPLISAGPLVRSGPDEPVSPSQRVFQVYGNDGTDWLHVETVPSSGAPPDGDRIGPWTISDRSGPLNDSILELATPAVTVRLWSQTLDIGQLMTIADQIRQNADGSWDLGPLPDDLVLIAVGPANVRVARRVVQGDPTRGEMVLALEVIPDAVTMLSTYGTIDAQVVDVNGERALHYERQLSYGTLGTLVWEYAPRVVVQFGMVDTAVDDLLKMATTIQVGTIDDWQSLPDISGGDGCPAFWC